MDREEKREMAWWLELLCSTYIDCKLLTILKKTNPNHTKNRIVAPQWRLSNQRNYNQWRMFWIFQCNNNRKRYRTKTYKGKQFQCNNSTLPCFFKIWSRGSPFLWLWILITNGWVIFQTQVRPIFHIHWKPWIRNRWPATIHSTWDNPTFQIARMHWNWSCWIWGAHLLGTPTTGLSSTQTFAAPCY